MEQKKIKTLIEEGHIHVRSIIEIVGKPKKYVQDSLKAYLQKIKEDKNYSFIKESIEPPEKQDNFFTTFAEVEFLVKDSSSLIAFCFDYMPSSVEIIAPERIVIGSQSFSGLLNDLEARLHAMNTGMIELKESNTFYIRNTAVLLRNFIVVLLSARPMTIEQMHPYLGVKLEDISKVLNVLEKENKVKKEGEFYRVVPNVR